MATVIQLDNHCKLTGFSQFLDSGPKYSVYNRIRDDGINLIWKEISFGVKKKRSPFSPAVFKTILHPMSGMISSGSLTALMGPSGSGKTTLLNCISGRIGQEGFSGEVYLSSTHKIERANESFAFRVGFVPQNDNLFMEFTVLEHLWFASRMTNDHFTEKQHTTRIREVMSCLDIDSCQNQNGEKLSGGQLKRLTIAVELISQPSILFLDEPTSGLDSDSSEKLVALLKSLTQNPSSPAIMATIHQPSAQVLKLFDHIYLMSRLGVNIFSGSPSNVSFFLQSHGYPPKKNTNPAEYMITISNGKYGIDRFDEMTEETQILNRRMISKYESSDETKITKKLQDIKTSYSASLLLQVWMLGLRCFSRTVIRSWEGFLKVSCIVLITIFLHSLGQESPISEAACFEDVAEALPLDIGREMTRVTEVTMFVFLLVSTQVFFNSFLSSMTYHREMITIMREINNSWYSPTAYFFARSLSDLVVMVTAALIPAITAFFLIEGNLESTSYSFIRIFAIFSISLLVMVLWESRGQFASILFPVEPRLGFILMTCVSFSFIFVGDFYVPPERLTLFAKVLEVLSDVTPAVHANIIAHFGLGRCSSAAIQSLDKFLPNTGGPLGLSAELQKISQYGDAQIRLITVALNLTDGYLEPLIAAVEELFEKGSLLTRESNITDTILTLDSTDNQYPSMILAFFKQRDNMLMTHINFLIACVIIAKVMLFLAICWRTQRRSTRSS
jgi:ABC-type multidrug transport system ATPase subunit